ncbi:MAG: hypothetical protein QOF77_2207 [Solirubrobacteraceae bacterium]|jgi:hypothetical protein|nr:hypothetical protein [Solirubrobacteraceae bacterium]
MLSIRRKGRRGRAAKRTAGGMMLRLAVRVLRPFGPGAIAAAAGTYFLDKTAGSERRKKALGMVSGVGGRIPGKKE